MVDLEFHAGPPPSDPMQKQAEVLDALGMPQAIRMRHATPHFAHVFAGDGYSSGYYSYMWSEVMDADAFDAFVEAGDAFDPETAGKLERFILSAGGSKEAEALYTAFRGRMPGGGCAAAGGAGWRHNFTCLGKFHKAVTVAGPTDPSYIRLNRPDGQTFGQAGAASDLFAPSLEEEDEAYGQSHRDRPWNNQLLRCHHGW